MREKTRMPKPTIRVINCKEGRVWTEKRTVSSEPSAVLVNWDKDTGTLEFWH